MPFWLYFWAFVYAGTALALVRSFAEHRAEHAVERRTAIVERSWLLGPLFLFNNLHVVHHMRASLPWYELPRWYRLNRAAVLERNGNLVYRSYFDVARRYLFKPHDRALHPRDAAALSPRTADARP
jgi:fatty acid desaturase